MLLEELASVSSDADGHVLQRERPDERVTSTDQHGREPRVRRGERLSVTVVGAIAVAIRRNGRDESYFIVSARSHDGHGRLAAGDALVAVSDSAATGKTEVVLPGCGCQAFLAPL